jgi:adenylate kinase
MHKYVIMGVQGCGKGTQAKLLARDFDLVHISVGDIFRWHIQNYTKLGARIKRLVAAGGLVPDEVVEDVVKARLNEHDWNHGFILDGFPRDRSQAEFFLESYDIDAVILIGVPDEVVADRILARRLCRNCGQDYNLTRRPTVADRCDHCHGPVCARTDDTPDALQARLRDYRTKTEPVLELFRRKGLVLVVDGTAAPEAVQDEIRRGLGLEQGPPRDQAPSLQPTIPRSEALRVVTYHSRP